MASKVGTLNNLPLPTSSAVFGISLALTTEFYPTSLLSVPLVDQAFLLTASSVWHALPCSSHSWFILALSLLGPSGSK